MWQVLLVGEDRHLAAALARACAKFARVQPVSGVTEADAALRASPVHLVVIHHPLPDGSGLQLAASLMAGRPWQPIILSPAQGSEAICSSALKLDVRDYLPQPWSVSDMCASIHAVLSVSEQSREPRGNVFGRPVAAGRHDRRPHGDRHELLVRWARQLIDERYADPPRLRDLARHLGLSVFTLSRKFKQITRVGFRRYTIDARIAGARELLLTSRHTVTEVAQLVGFSDLPRFDKVFKARVGLSPSSYRARNIG